MRTDLDLFTMLIIARLSSIYILHMIGQENGFSKIWSKYVHVQVSVLYNFKN